MVKFVMLIGIPGSGKTTWAREKMKYRSSTYIHLSSDEIRNKIASDTGETDRNKLNAKTFKVMNDSTIECLKRGISIFYDATNLTVKDRRHIMKKVIALQSELEIETKAVVFNTPFEVCYERNRRRKEPVPNEYMRKYRDMFTYPTEEEGFGLIIEL